MPGLLLCFVMRFDAHKKLQLKNGECGIPGPVSSLERVKYFHCALIGYFLGKKQLYRPKVSLVINLMLFDSTGLLSATVSSELFKAAQPALLYLVPFTLLPLLLMAYLKGDLRRMWTGIDLLQPNISAPTKHIDV